MSALYTNDMWSVRPSVRLSPWYILVYVCVCAWFVSPSVCDIDLRQIIPSCSKHYREGGGGGGGWEEN
jgi:hypothetical protein